MQAAEMPHHFSLNQRVQGSSPCAPTTRRHRGSGKPAGLDEPMNEQAGYGLADTGGAVERAVSAMRTAPAAAGGYEARVRLSALTLSAWIRPLMPRLRRIAANSDRRVANSLIVPSR